MASCGQLWHPRKAWRKRPRHQHTYPGQQPGIIFSVECSPLWSAYCTWAADMTWRPPQHIAQPPHIALRLLFSGQPGVGSLHLWRAIYCSHIMIGFTTDEYHHETLKLSACPCPCPFPCPYLVLQACVILTIYPCKNISSAATSDQCSFAQLLQLDCSLAAAGCSTRALPTG